MHKLTIVAVSLAVFVLPAAAQKEFPRAEVFGGYQFLHLYPSLNANGWNAAVNGNVNRWFGVTADFSGSYKNILAARIKTVGTFTPTCSAQPSRRALGH